MPGRPVYPTLYQFIPMLMLGLLVMSGMRIAICLYALAQQASPLRVGSLVAMFSIFPMLCAVPVGRWLDKVGMVLPLHLGAFCLCLGAGLVLWLPQYPVFYLTAALSGIGYMLLHLVAQNVIGNVGPPERRTERFTWLAMGTSAAGFAGPVLAGLLIDFVKHRAAFTLFAALALLLLGVLQWRCFHQPLPHVAGAQELHGGALALCWRQPRLRTLYLVSILLSASWDLFSFVTPIQGSKFGFSAATIGLILGCFSLGTSLIRAMMPLVSRHLSPWNTIITTFIVASSCFTLYPWMHHALGMMLLAFVLGLALGMAQPNLLHLLFQAAPRGRLSEVLGIRLTISNATQVSLPLAFGAVGSGMGLLPMFALMISLLMGGLVLIWRWVVLPKRHAKAGA